ncbi:exonuclease SbcC [Pseudoalteromonas sp. SW0106-04]|uniref:AAA family ATPase n=1 Tax=Pseudoalteromonas sp. SW0106-04 TaxID=1702169 RepID=UPI0006B5521A|nr:AAA family ATPase [Pseudoalteromonas sp. SW0106-04]GAP73716.1 exonuclease SbcC [Pseudoalteromonas sp. SW0106-04]
MKINRLQIHNLASLLDADIDFSRPPLRDAGLFAITGDTGAGKSTILDALCLGLYDKTARLSNESTQKVDFNGDNVRLNDPRHLLRRGTGIGWVKVDFVAIDGAHYRALWQVTRARKKPNGKLQAPTHALYLMPQEQLVSDGKLETKKTIERLVGLNFEQFTRAVMLAQNEFSAFLRAQGDERAVLLERLSGTQKYSVVGQRVYSGYKAKLNDVEAFKASMDAVDILDEQQLQELNEQQHQYIEQQQQCQKRREQVAKHLQWFAAEQQLQHEIADLQQRIQTTSNSLERLEPRVREAQRVKQCWQIEDNLTSTARLQQRLAQQQTRQEELTCSDAKSVWQHGEQQQQLAQQQLRHAQQQYAQRKEKLNAAVALDVKIAQKKEVLAAKRSEFEQTSAQQLQLTQQSQNLAAQVDESNRRLDEYTTQLESQPWLAELVKNWSHYHHLWQRINSYDATYKEKNEQLQASNNELSKLDQSLATLNEENTTFQQSIQALEQQIVSLQPQPEAFSATELQRQLGTWQQALERFQQWHSSNRQLVTVRHQQQSLHAELEQKQQQLHEASQHHSVLEQQLSHARQAYEQVKLRASEQITHLRTQLKSGEPCMVCGSEHHPFAENDDNNHAFAALLADFEQAYATAQKNLDQHYTKRHALQTEIQLAQQQIDNVSATEQQLKSQLQQLAQQLEPFIQGKPLDELSDQDFTKPIADIQQQYQQLEQLEQQLVKLRSELKVQQQSSGELQGQLQSCEQRRQQLQLQTQRIAYELETEQQQCQQSIAELREHFSEAPWWQDSLHQLARLWQQLVEQKQQFEQLQNEYARAEQQTTQLNQQRDQIFTKLESLQSQQQKLGEQLQMQEQEITHLLTERITLIAHGQDPKAQLEELEESIEKAQQTLDTQQAACQQQQRRYEQEQSEYQHLVKNCSQLQQDIEELKKAFDVWYQDYRAFDEALTIEQIKNLLTQDKQQVQAVLTEHATLEQTQVRFQAQLEHSESRLQQLVKSRPDKNLTELEAQKRQLDEQFDDSQQALTLLGARLENHRQNVERLAEQGEQLKDLQQQLATWTTLNSALGDAQGKRLRNLVQSQTLAILLGYANQHLHALSKRYRLTRITGTLDIAIIDHDMADEQRSVNTLSGGESFLVSLALALGLASLSSNKVKIESLFIDEGFGTLDSETLSIAMDALDNLQAQGRKVGVISHIPQLTERVATQVKVRKRPGGYSVVECE